MIPIHKGAEQDPASRAEQFEGWFTELNDERWQPTSMPTYLEEFGYFADVLVGPERPGGAARPALGRGRRRRVGRVPDRRAAEMAVAQSAADRRAAAPVAAAARGGRAACSRPSSSPGYYLEPGAGPDRAGDVRAAGRRPLLRVPRHPDPQAVQPGWVGLDAFRDAADPGPGLLARAAQHAVVDRRLARASSSCSASGSRCCSTARSSAGGWCRRWCSCPGRCRPSSPA